MKKHLLLLVLACALDTVSCRTARWPLGSTAYVGTLVRVYESQVTCRSDGGGIFRGHLAILHPGVPLTVIDDSGYPCVWVEAERRWSLVRGFIRRESMRPAPPPGGARPEPEEPPSAVLIERDARAREQGEVERWEQARVNATCPGRPFDEIRLPSAPEDMLLLAFDLAACLADDYKMEAFKVLRHIRELCQGQYAGLQLQPGCPVEAIVLAERERIGPGARRGLAATLDGNVMNEGGPPVRAQARGEPAADVLSLTSTGFDGAEVARWHAERSDGLTIWRFQRLVVTNGRDLTRSWCLGEDACEAAGHGRVRVGLIEIGSGQ
jgi:hypothetical protein